MILVKKENKLVQINELSLNSYLKDGFDHVEFDPSKGDYKVITPAKNKLVPYAELLKAEAKIEKLEAEIASLKAEKPKAK